MIDISFDFTTDTKDFWTGFWDRKDGLGYCGKDPDSWSPTLRHYHALLWSKETPSGVTIELKETSWRDYLTWNRQRFASDSITTGFRYSRNRGLIDQVIDAVPDYRSMMENFIHKNYTMGGSIIFPKHPHSMNQDRGVNAKIRDRWDLTLECIRRYYAGENSPLYNTCLRDKAFYDLFLDFKGYVDFFYLQDMVSPDYSTVKMWMNTDLFINNPFPNNATEYLAFLDSEIEFVELRNKRIAKTQ